MIKDIKSYWSNRSPQRLFFEASTYLFVATLSLWDNFNTIALWFFISSSLLLIKPKERFQNFRKNGITFYFLSALYFLFVLGWFFSTNEKDALRDIERTLTLILIPLIILSHKREDFNLKKIYISLGIGLFIGIVVCWAFIIESIVENATPLVQAGYFFKWIYNGWNALKPLNGHPSYFAIMLVVFILGIIRMPEFSTFRKNKLKLLFLLAPFFLFLIETSSRIGIICLIVILLITIFKKLEIKKVFYLTGLVIILAAFAVKFDYLGSKFATIIDAQGNVTLDRYPRWIAIFSEFEHRGNWIFGVGTGDSQALYNLAYSKNNFTIALDNHYNAHNQYLEFIVSNGILGLCVYLLVLLLFFRKTALNGEALSFFIIIILFSGSESIFGKSKGVFIFAFFYSLFILWYSAEYRIFKKNKANERICVE